MLLVVAMCTIPKWPALLRNGALSERQSGMGLGDLGDFEFADHSFHSSRNQDPRNKYTYLSTLASQTSSSSLREQGLL
jgi:hypothetical protein